MNNNGRTGKKLLELQNQLDIFEFGHLISMNQHLLILICFESEKR